MNHGFKLHPDGTLEITMPKGKKVGRVLVCEAGTQNGTLMYPDCDDCIKNGGDWECDRMHCHKGEIVSNDVISRKQALEAIQDAHHKTEVMSMFDNGKLSGLAKGANIIRNLPSAEPESTRTFVELVVRYPDPELCAYKEYKGKPYYSIKYIENGEAHVGYGTYNPEVLSKYLKEYFISSAQPERKKGKWIGGSDERFVKCSECGMESTKNALMEIALFGEKEPHFCPNCGSYNGGMEHGIIKHHYQNPIRRKKNDSD